MTPLFLTWPASIGTGAVGRPMKKTQKIRFLGFY